MLETNGSIIQKISWIETHSGGLLADRELASGGKILLRSIL